MAKDPAFLFYTQDFIVGTMHFTNEQVGIYIRLLCMQHQHGGLIESDVFESMVGENKIVRRKFIETEDGFFNDRLMNEMQKRVNKSKNLSENATKRWKNHTNERKKACKSNAIASNRHMPTEDANENENEDENNISKGVVRGKPKRKVFRRPTVDQIRKYCTESNIHMDCEYFFNYYEARDWHLKDGNKIKNWKSVIRTWERNGYEKGRAEQHSTRSGNSSKEDRRKAFEGITTEVD